MRGLLLAGALSVASTAWAGRPSPDLPCSDRYAGAREYRTIEELPPALVAELVRRWGRATATPADIAATIAPRDADFQVSDALTVPLLPFRRFMLAIGQGDRFLVWYEQGGIAFYYHLVILQASGPERYRPIAHFIGGLEQLCEAAAKFGKAPTGTAGVIERAW